MSVCTLLVPHSCYKTCRSKSTQSQALLFSFRFPARNAHGFFVCHTRPIHSGAICLLCTCPVAGVKVARKRHLILMICIKWMELYIYAPYILSKCDHWYLAWQPHALARKPSKRLHAAQQRRSDSWSDSTLWGVQYSLRGLFTHESPRYLQGTRYSIDTSLRFHNLSLQSDSSWHDINMVMPNLNLWSGCTNSTAMNVSDNGKIQALRAKLIFVDSATTLRPGFPIPAGAKIRPDRIWGPPSLLCNVYQGSSPGIRRPRREVSHSPGIIPFTCYMPSCCGHEYIFISLWGVWTGELTKRILSCVIAAALLFIGTVLHSLPLWSKIWTQISLGWSNQGASKTQSVYCARNRWNMYTKRSGNLMGKSRRNYEVNGEMELTETVWKHGLAPDRD